MFNLEPRTNFRLVAAASALSLAAVSACGAHTASEKQPGCDSQAIVLDQGVQHDIITTQKWPKNLSNLSHVGKIIGIELVTANGLQPGSTGPSLAEAHTIVNAFSEEFNSPEMVEILPADPKLTGGRLELIEFDQTCASEIGPVPQSQTSQTT